jgi:thioesterase domain-containing protein
VQLLAAVEQETGIDLPPASIFDGATVRQMAELIETGDPRAARGVLVPVQAQGTRTPFFCVHPISGEVLCFAHLARHLGSDQPFYGLQRTASIAATSVECQAASYVDEIVALQPRGPYLLGGYSGGATVALEMAQQLTAKGQEVGLLAIIDHPAPGADRLAAWSMAATATFVARDLPRWARDFTRRGTHDRATALPYSIAKVKTLLSAAVHGRPAASALEAITDLSALPDSYRERYQHRMLEQHRALREYQPRPYAGRVTLFRARVQPLVSSHDPALGWRALATGGVDVHETPGTHLSMLREPQAQDLALHLSAHLEAHAARMAWRRRDRQR